MQNFRKMEFTPPPPPPLPPPPLQLGTWEYFEMIITMAALGHHTPPPAYTILVPYSNLHSIPYITMIIICIAV